MMNDHLPTIYDTVLNIIPLGNDITKNTFGSRVPGKITNRNDSHDQVGWIHRRTRKKWRRWCSLGKAPQWYAPVWIPSDWIGHQLPRLKSNFINKKTVFVLSADRISPL